jgi:hypothetical protein
MKGILFTEPMFHKAASGEKTQTRRIINSRTGFFKVESKDGHVTGVWQCDANEWVGDNLIPVRPRYKPGEKLCLKEPYRITHIDNIWFMNYLYISEKIELNISAGNNKIKTILIQQEKAKSGWCNKLFMPEWCTRYFIEITGVRIEQLQDISDEDCLKEGIEEQQWTDYPYNTFYVIPDTTCELYNAPQEAYAALIDSINGKGTWERNPFVFVYDFRLTTK